LTSGVSSLAKDELASSIGEKEPDRERLYPIRAWVVFGLKKILGWSFAIAIARVGNTVVPLLCKMESIS
jgi:hypothetical protein